jgi:hypothetical protein
MSALPASLPISTAVSPPKNSPSIRTARPKCAVPPAGEYRAGPEACSTHKVLYIEPRILHDWAERDGRMPRAARWVVFRDPALRGALIRADLALAGEPDGLAVEEALLNASPRQRRIFGRRRPGDGTSGPSTPPSAGHTITSASDGTKG